MGTQSSGMNISYSSGSGRGTSGGVRGASGRGAVKPTLKGKLAEPSKNSVKVKPAAKQTGNPFNMAKSRESMLSSASRGGVTKGGSLGKAIDARKVTGITTSKLTPPNKPSRTPDTPAKTTVKINTNPLKSKGIFDPLKKKIAASNTPANRAKAANNARALKAANKKK